MGTSATECAGKSKPLVLVVSTVYSRRQGQQRSVAETEGDFVVNAIAVIEKTLPFPLLAFDSDNGSEFLNWHLVSYLQERSEEPKVAFTRPRPYPKNGNARVEQKNWTHARQLLGDDRLDCMEMLDLVHEAYRNWYLLKNYFNPVMKLTEKVRNGGTYQTTYGKPTTPADRVLEWPDQGRYLPAASSSENL